MVGKIGNFIITTTTTVRNKFNEQFSTGHRHSNIKTIAVNESKRNDL